MDQMFIIDTMYNDNTDRYWDFALRFQCKVNSTVTWFKIFKCMSLWFAAFPDWNVKSIGLIALKFCTKIYGPQWRILIIPATPWPFLYHYYGGHFNVLSEMSQQLLVETFGLDIHALLKIIYNHFDDTLTFNWAPRSKFFYLYIFIFGQIPRKLMRHSQQLCSALLAD